MTISIECNNKDIKITLLSLHEEVVRNIFFFLSYEDIYFTIRNVCIQLRNIVDDYVEVAGRFFLSYGPETTTKQLYVFKRNKEIVCICCIPSELNIPYPNKGLRSEANHSKYHFGGGSFGATVNDKLIIGIYYWEDDQTLGYYSHYSYYYDKSKPYLVEYDISNSKWRSIDIHNFRNQLEGFYENDIFSSCLVGTKLGESMLIFTSEYNVGNSFIHYNLNQFEDQATVKKKQAAELSSSKNTYNSISSKKLSPLKIPILFGQKKDMKNITDCAIIHTTFNEIMLVGGKIGRNELNRKLWRIDLDKVDRKDGSLYYLWIADPIASITPRIRPISFKLRKNLFIAGGQSLNESDECKCLESEYYQEMDEDGIMKCFSRHCNTKDKWKPLMSCDRYDMLEDKYYESCYYLPWPIKDVDKVVTDVNETFAIITRRNTGKCLIFSEGFGFREISNSDIGENPKHPWGYYNQLRSDNRIFFRVQ